MLPDFAHMIGLGRVSSTHPVLAEGIAFHHATDEVFHDSSCFVRLQTEARRSLADAGVRRGARLATAHVGLELMLDAELARDTAAFDHYVAALESAAARSLSAHVSWSESKPTRSAYDNYERLRQTLLRRRDVVVPVGPTALFERLHRILSRRPALALSIDDRSAVEDWAAKAWPEVQRMVPQWIAELRRGLGLPTTRSAHLHPSSETVALGPVPRVLASERVPTKPVTAKPASPERSLSQRPLNTDPVPPSQP
jgi:hypothetical protein